MFRRDLIDFKGDEYRAVRSGREAVGRRTAARAAVLLAMILVAPSLTACQEASGGAAVEAGSSAAELGSSAAGEAEDGELPGEQTEAEDGELSGEQAEEGEVESIQREQLSLHLDDDYRTTYEVFVYSFADGDGDGIGDLKGLTQKLDYINDGDDTTTEDLECNEIWLMPIFPSPTYHKYDATDYKNIDPEYGTLEDFDALLEQCHERDVRVILDLAVNHTSSEHPWFREAVAYLNSLPEGAQPDSTTCPYVDYYNFSREKAAGYDPLPDSQWYYEARFWSGMPDLNLDNEQVRSEIREIVAFWLERGVDGFRLDAVTSYYTDHDDQNADFISWLTETVKTLNPKAYLVGECWEGQKTYAKYYDSGIDSLFDFDFAGQEGVIASVTKGQKGASTFVERMVEEEKLYQEHNPNFVNAPFYTNHDMARSAGYYPKETEARVKFAQALNLLQTGNAFLYYGEELGMKGSGKDENKRLPMRWTAADQKAAEPSWGTDGMTVGPKDAESVKQKFEAVDVQTLDENSILSYVRRAIRLRQEYPVIARGKTTAVEELCSKTVGAFTRTMPGLGKEAAEPKSQEATNAKQEPSESTGASEDSWKSVLVLFNTGAEPESIDLSKAREEIGLDLSTMTNQGMPKSSEASAVSTLSVNTDEPVTFDENTVTLPSYGIAVIEMN